MKKSLIFSLVSVFALVLVVSVGTYAWWTWTSTNTVVTFTVSGGSMTIDGGGNETDKKMVPTDECNGSNAIVKKVVVKANNTTGNEMTATVSLDLTGLATELKTANMRYMFVEKTGSTEPTCTRTGANVKNFKDAGSTLELANFDVPANTTTDISKEYKLFIWLDADETSSSSQNKTLSFKFTGLLQ